MSHIVYLRNFEECPFDGILMLYYKLLNKIVLNPYNDSQLKALDVQIGVGMKLVNLKYAYSRVIQIEHRQV